MSAPTDQQGPQRWPGDSRPPFLPGNTAAMRHGAQSPRLVAPLAEQVREWIVAAAPWVASPAFASAVDSYCWIEAQVRLLRAWVNAEGMRDADGEQTSAVNQLDRLEGRLERARMRLGLDVVSLGDVLQKAASVASVTGDQQSLDALADEGRRILAARLAELQAGDTEAVTGG